MCWCIVSSSSDSEKEMAVIHHMYMPRMSLAGRMKAILYSWREQSCIPGLCRMLQKPIPEYRTPMAGEKREQKRHVGNEGQVKKGESEAQSVGTEAISTRVTAYHAELVESLFACSGPAANVPLLSSKDISVAHAAFGATVRPSAVASGL